MTAPLSPTPALTAEEAARVAVFDAAEEPEEITAAKAAAQIPYMMENTPEEFERVLNLAWPLCGATVAEDIDWGVHRGSCRVFYAERRCTCGATVASDPMARPAEPTGGLREQIAEAIAGTVNGVATDLTRRMADALLSGPLAPLLDAQEAVRRVEALLERRGIWPTPIKDEIRRALAALRGGCGPLAGQHATDKETHHG